MDRKPAPPAWKKTGVHQVDLTGELYLPNFCPPGPAKTTGATEARKATEPIPAKSRLAWSSCRTTLASLIFGNVPMPNGSRPGAWSVCWWIPSPPGT